MDNAYDQLALMAWDDDGGVCSVLPHRDDEPAMSIVRSPDDSSEET